MFNLILIYLAFLVSPGSFAFYLLALFILAGFLFFRIKNKIIRFMPLLCILLYITFFLVTY